MEAGEVSGPQLLAEAGRTLQGRNEPRLTNPWGQTLYTPANPSSKRQAHPEV